MGKEVLSLVQGSEGSGFRHNVAKVPRLLHGVEARGSLDRVGVG